MTLEALFYGAMDARLALSALRAIGAEPSDPIPVDTPRAGRPWLLKIDFDANRSSSRFPDAGISEEVSQAVTRWNGVMVVP